MILKPIDYLQTFEIEYQTQKCFVIKLIFNNQKEIFEAWEFNDEAMTTIKYLMSSEVQLDRLIVYTVFGFQGKMLHSEDDLGDIVKLLNL